MTYPSIDDIISTVELSEIERQAELAIQAINESVSEENDLVDPNETYQSLIQFFDIMHRIEQQESHASNVVAESNMNDVADHGLRLLMELSSSCEKLDEKEVAEVFQNLSIPLAVWAAQRNLTLGYLDVVVNAVSSIANNTHSTKLLGRLADIINLIIEAVNPEIKNDTQGDDPHRPWRILNLNHCIIATRSHDPKRMEAVFEQLIYRLPNDAPGFFAEGKLQMENVEYPEHVQDIMEKYYQRTNQPTLH